MKKNKQFIKNYFLKKRQKLFSKKKIINKDVTILSNCCLAGLMYHDLKKEFLSPTINLYFGHHSFIDYVMHIKEYTNNGYLVDSGFLEKQNGAPIGILKCNGLPDVEIHFLHFHSFAEAEKKWKDRSAKINFEKIFLVIEAKEEHEHKILDEYVNLPYKKIIFSDLQTDMSKSIMHMSVYDCKKQKSITSFKFFSCKRWYDEYDFVDSIFNCKF